MQSHRAPRWLIGGHAQTIWPALFARRFDGAPPRFRRERWITPDADFVDVDWAEPEQVESTAQSADGVAPHAHGYASGHESDADRAAGFDATKRPLLVLFHGLEGSSASHYAQAFADRARQQGWRFVVPHFRGCSGYINLAPRAYHSGDFEEIGWMLGRLRASHRGPIVVVGVSLGGNALMRWAAEAGDSARAQVEAVCAVSSPLDLTAGGRAIGEGFNRLVYTRMFLRTMRPKALAKLAQHPGLFDRDRLLAARSLHAFDDIFTAPLHGFQGADDYWSRASAKPHLSRIRIPALVVNALNDPFVPAASLPRMGEAGSCVTLWQPAHGGHVGFATGGWPGHVGALPTQVVGWLAARLPPRAEQTVA